MVHQLSKEEQYKLELLWKEVVERLLALKEAVRVFQSTAPDVRTPEILGPVLCRVYQMHFHRMSFAALLDDIVYQLNHRTEGLAALTPKHPTRMDSTVPEPTLVEPVVPVVEEKPKKKKMATPVFQKLRSPEEPTVITVGPPEVLRELGKGAEQPESDWTPLNHATVRGPLPPPDRTQ